MTYNSPPPPPFLPPPPPSRKSRSGGILLLLAGILAAASPFITWIPTAEKLSLKNLADQVAQFAGDIPFLDNFQNWFYAILGGAAIAIIFGLIGLAGNKGINITVGLFGLLAAIAISYPPIWLLTGTNSAESLVTALGAGYYTAAAAGFLALIATLFAFIGAAKK